MSPHDSDGRVRAVIEFPRGSRNKLKYEPGLDVFVLDHVLPVGLEFPLDYGFIPGTRGQDGDPIDVLVLMDAPVVPGCAVPVRLVAVIEAEQADDPDRWFRNDRLIGIAHASDSLANVQDTSTTSNRSSSTRSRPGSGPTTRSAADGSSDRAHVDRRALRRSL